MRLEMKKLNIQGGSPKKQYRGGNCLKRGAWTFCRFKWVAGGPWQERGRGVIPQCTLCGYNDGYIFIQPFITLHFLAN